MDPDRQRTIEEHRRNVARMIANIKETQERELKLQPLQEHLADSDIVSESDIDAFARKLLERCYLRSDEMSVTRGLLLYKGKPIEDSPETIRKLANTPRSVTKPMAKWICDNLKELIPETDDTKMEIAKGLVWDSHTVRFTKGDPDEQAN